MQSRFKGRVALVTGATSGIGKETALQFAREGAQVVLAARRAELGRALEQEIAGLGGVALFVETDVTRADSLENMVEAALGRFGRIDCAFNNAGIAG